MCISEEFILIVHTFIFHKYLTILMNEGTNDNKRTGESRGVALTVEFF